VSNSADNSPGIQSNLDEDSDVIELTEEVGSTAPAMDDLAFAIPEFKIPTGQASPVSNDADEFQDGPEEAFDREELVRTVRMEAFDRHQLELLDAVRKWSISAHLRDHRFAPDILVGPPRVLTKKWQDSVAIAEDDAQPGASNSDTRKSVAETVRTNTISDEDIARSTLENDPSRVPEAELTVPSLRAMKSEVTEEPTPSRLSAQPVALPSIAADGFPSIPMDDARDLDSEDLPELELDSEILEDATPLPQPPPKPDFPEVRTPIRARQNTQPVPARSKGSNADAGDDISGIVQELLDEKPKTVPNAAELKRANWFVDVFSEEYLRTLPKDIARQTEVETEFILESLGVKKGARIFDLACGFGRHSINLARRGYEVAGLDLSMAMLQRALTEAQRHALSIKFIHGDMRELNFNEIFDACFLWQTSFGYFDDRTNFKVLQGVHRALKSGGRVLIDMVNRDYVVAEMPSRTWWEGVECVFLEEVEFDYETSVLHTKRSFIYEDGSPPQEFNSYIRLYSLHELNQILSIAGFDLLEVTGELCHRGSFLGPNSHSMILLAEKR
jgi:SAM-dependent methyltransferase